MVSIRIICYFKITASFHHRDHATRFRIFQTGEEMEKIADMRCDLQGAGCGQKDELSEPSTIKKSVETLFTYPPMVRLPARIINQIWAERLFWRGHLNFTEPWQRI